MRILLLLTLSTALYAAPIVTPSGAITPTGDAYFLDLQTIYGTNVDATATLTSDMPLATISFYLDNEVFGFGSGVNVSLDGVQVLHTGVGEVVQQAYSFTSGIPFTVIRFWTNAASGWRERLWATEVEVVEAGEVPEPGTAFILAIGLAVLVWAAMRRG